MKKGIALTRDQFASAETLLARGFSRRDVAERLGREYHSFNRSLRQFRSGKIRFKAESDAEISRQLLEARLAGKTLKEAGVSFNLPKENVHARLLRMGYDSETIEEEREMRRAA